MRHQMIFSLDGLSPSDQNLSCFHLTSRHIQLNTEIYQLFIRMMNDDFMNVYQCTMYVELLTMWQKIQEAFAVHPATRERAEVCWKERMQLQFSVDDVFFHDNLRHKIIKKTSVNVPKI